MFTELKYNRSEIYKLTPRSCQTQPSAPWGTKKSQKTFIGRSRAGCSGQQVEMSPYTAVLARGRCNLNVIEQLWVELVTSWEVILFIVNISPSWTSPTLLGAAPCCQLSLLQPPAPRFLPLLAKNRAVKESSSKSSLAPCPDLGRQLCSVRSLRCASSKLCSATLAMHACLSRAPQPILRAPSSPNWFVSELQAASCWVCSSDDLIEP